MKRILILQIVWLAKTCCAQLTLSESEFVRIIQQFHPVVKQAGINVSIAKAQRTAARGKEHQRDECDRTRRGAEPELHGFTLFCPPADLQNISAQKVTSRVISAAGGETDVVVA